MSYTAPIKDMLFAMEHLAHLDQVAQIPGFEDYLEDRPKGSSSAKGAGQKTGMDSDTPGFEDYLDK